MQSRWRLRLSLAMVAVVAVIVAAVAAGCSPAGGTANGTQIVVTSGAVRSSGGTPVGNSLRATDAAGTVLPVNAGEAVKAALAELPASFQNSHYRCDYNPSYGSHGAWLVTFGGIDATPQELGWQENSITVFNHADDKDGVTGLPPGEFANAFVFVDPVSGAVVHRELNNGLLLGPIPSIHN